MRRLRAIMLAQLLGAVATHASEAADLGLPPPPMERGGHLRFETMWGREYAHPPDGPRPRRRVSGDSDYVGSRWGLGKPAVSGIGPRPDWGRSSAD